MKANQFLSVESGNYKGYPNPSLVVSVDEASKIYKKSDILLIDTRNYWKYAKGHIPGAFNFELYAFHWIDTSREGINLFAKQMVSLFSALGVNDETRVIFYQNNSGYDAARGVWLLNFLGHKRARMLDGGLNLWKRRSLPLSTNDPEVRKPGNMALRKDDSLVATLDYLAKGVKSKSLEIVDARTPGEFDGSFRRARKLGHIPGAVNSEWKLALRRDGTLKDASQLRQLFEEKDLPQDREVVTYCQSGYRAAHSWLIFKLLGYEHARNYLGSWYEWGNAPAVPAGVEK